MILPAKHIPLERSLLGIGAEVLEELDQPKTVSRLWDDMKKRRGEYANRLPYDWFLLSLNMLYAIDAVTFERGRIRRVVLK